MYTGLLPALVPTLCAARRNRDCCYATRYRVKKWGEAHFGERISRKTGSLGIEQKASQFIAHMGHDETYRSHSL